MNNTNPRRQAAWLSATLTLLAAVTGLAALNAGHALFVSARALGRLHATARREQQAEAKEVNNLFEEYKHEQAQELARLHEEQEMRMKRILERQQQQKQHARQRSGRMQQLNTDIAQLLSQQAGLPRNSREFQDALFKLQALRTEQARLNAVQTSEFNKQVRLDRLTSAADQLQYEMVGGLDKRHNSPEYQAATNDLNRLHGEFLKLADPITAECYSNSFSITGLYAPSSNLLAAANALESATAKLGPSQRERINTLRREGYRLVESIVRRGFDFAAAVAAFIAILVAIGIRGRSPAARNCR